MITIQSGNVRSYLKCRKQFLFKTLSENKYITNNMLLRKVVDKKLTDLDKIQEVVAEKFELGSISNLYVSQFLQNLAMRYYDYLDTVILDKKNKIIAQDKIFVANINGHISSSIKVDYIIEDKHGDLIAYKIYAKKSPYNKSFNNGEKSIYRQDVDGFLLKQILEKNFKKDFDRRGITLKFIYLINSTESEKKEKIDKNKLNVVQYDLYGSLYDVGTQAIVNQQVKGLEKELRNESELEPKARCIDCKYKTSCPTFSNQSVELQEEEATEGQGSIVQYTPNQLEAVLGDKAGIYRVVAGPGAGKTKVLVGKLVNLLSYGVDPSEVLFLTFSNAASDEMKSRIISSIAEEGLDEDLDIDKFNISTIHAFCFNIIKKYHKEFYFDNEPTVLSQEKNYEIIEGLYSKVKANLVDDPSEAGIGKYYFFEELKKDLFASEFSSNAFNRSGGLVKFIEMTNLYMTIIDSTPRYIYGSGGIDQLIKILFNKIGEKYENERQEYIAFFNTISQICVEYYNILLEENLIAFDSMIPRVSNYSRLLSDMDRQYPEAFNFKYVLIDESQDCSEEDLNLVNSIIQSKDFYQLFLVGDENQRIYDFRGACSKSLKEKDLILSRRYKRTTIQGLTIAEEIEPFKVHYIYLNQSFRSTQTVINEVNTLAQNSTYPFEDYKELESKMKDNQAELELMQDFDGITPYSMSVLNQGIIVNYGKIFRICKDLESKGLTEVEFRGQLTSQVKKLAESSKDINEVFLYRFLGFLLKHYENLNKTAILARSKRELDIISEILTMMKIPYKSNYSQTIDSLAGFKTLFGLMSILKALKEDKEIPDLSALVSILLMEDEIKDIEEDKDLDSFREKIDERVNELKVRVAKEDLKDILLEVLMGEDKLKVWVDILKDDEDLTFDELYKKYATIDKYGSDMSIETKDNGALNLLTMHSSKGLEFDFVFVVAKLEKASASHFYTLDISAERDNLRLLYVALSRAKYGLYLLGLR